MTAPKKAPESADEDELKLSAPMVWFLIIAVAAAVLVGLFLR
jgi:hypothetical protein